MRLKVKERWVIGGLLSSQRGPNFKSIYSKVANRYEFTNHLLTVGLDYVLRKRAVSVALEGENSLVLDVCTGTGDTLSELKKRAKAKDGEIIGLDFSREMLRKARLRVPGAPLILADASKIPIRSRCVDLITVTFALRNLRDSEAGLLEVLKEFFRILKDKGSLVLLETSQPRSSILRKIFQFYAKAVIPIVGFLLTGSKEGYLYLGRSIADFSGTREISTLLMEAGFKKVEVFSLLGGVAAIHKAFKA